MSIYYIKKELASKVLMIGVYYKNHTAGGMASVIQSYEQCIENLNYISTRRDGSKIFKVLYFIKAYLTALTYLLFNRQIKIVHIHTASGSSFWRKSRFVKLSKRLGKKVVLHCHGGGFKDFYDQSDRKEEIIGIISMVDTFIVLSDFWKKWFCTIGIDVDKIVVLNNIVDSPDIKEVNMPAGDNNRLRLLFLGTLVKEKGIFDLMDLIIRKKDYYRDKISLIIGGFKNEDIVKSYIVENAISDIVRFEGFVSGEKKKDCLNWADVYILPSYVEGLPISILEAMSYHHPIISTPVGSIPEIVQCGVNGMLVRPGNIDEIDNAIKFYINNKESIKIQGEESYKRVQPFLPQSVFSSLQSIYYCLLDN